jgi:hypothetical protein
MRQQRGAERVVTDDDHTDPDELRYCYALLERGGFPAVPRKDIGQYLKAQADMARIQNRPGDATMFIEAERAWSKHGNGAAMAVLAARMTKLKVRG